MEGSSQLQIWIKNEQNKDKQVFSVSRKKKKEEGKLGRKRGKMILYLQYNHGDEQQTTQDKAWKETWRGSHPKEGGWADQQELELLSYEQRFDLVGSTETWCEHPHDWF